MKTDIQQFEVFMTDYQDMVYSTAIRLLGNASDAEDIAQTVFVKAWDSFGMLSQSPTPGGWLKKVTTNLCLNHLSRYRARWRFFSEMQSDDDGRDFLETVPAPEAFEANVVADDRRQLLETAIQKLPTSQRVPLVLFHFDDISYDKIAARLGVSLSKVKTDIHRGRLKLRRHLEPLLGDEVAKGTREPRSANQPAPKPSDAS